MSAEYSYKVETKPIHTYTYEFTFMLGQKVVIEVSGEVAEIQAVTQRVGSYNDEYLLRYVNKHGVAVEQWWSEDALVTAKD